MDSQSAGEERWKWSLAYGWLPAWVVDKNGSPVYYPQSVRKFRPKTKLTNSQLVIRSSPPLPLSAPYHPNAAASIELR